MKQNLLNKGKGAVFFGVLLAGIFSVNAQQDPYQAHFAYNRLTYNPAAVSSFGKYTVNFLHHQQWVSFGGGEPQTQFVNLALPFTRSHGLGVQFFNDKAGYERTMNLTLSYSYTFRFGTQHNLSLGAGAGFVQKSINGAELDPWHVNDPKVPVSMIGSTKPDFNAGIMYHSTGAWKPWAGIGVLHLLPQDMNYAVLNNAVVSYKLKQHLYVQGGFEWPMAARWDLRPSLLLRTDLNKYQPDLSVEAVFNKRFRGGLAYRTGDALSAILGAEVFSGFQVGYSYDLTRTNIWKVSSGTHEIFLSYAFLPKLSKKPAGIKVPPRKSPRYF